jgi:hypothetical protein
MLALFLLVELLFQPVPYRELRYVEAAEAGVPAMATSIILMY